MSHIVIYCVYDQAGTILRTGSCSRSSLAIQAGDGEGVLEVDECVHWGTHKIVDGVAVPVT